MPEEQKRVILTGLDTDSQIQRLKAELEKQGIKVAVIAEELAKYQLVSAEHPLEILSAIPKMVVAPDCASKPYWRMFDKKSRFY